MNPSARLDPYSRRFVEQHRSLVTPLVTEDPIAEMRENMRTRQGVTLQPAGIARTHHTCTHCDFELVRPAAAKGPLPVIVYFHGGGWVFGDFDTHARFAYDLVLGTGAALAFPVYDRSPESIFPVAVEQCYRFTAWLAENAAGFELDGSRIVVAGDSAGGTLAATTANLAAERGGPDLRLQALLYPVTSMACDTPSYREFATGLNLEAASMRWYWDQYAPTPGDRLNPLASPLLTPDAILARTPPALVLTAEFDVLRDEGEEYARRLMEAGVPTYAWRALGTVHSFLTATGLKDSPMTQAGTLFLVSHLRRAFELPAY